MGVHQARDRQDLAVSAREADRRSPTNRAALAAITDPYAIFFRKALADTAIPVLDSVIPLKEALLYYVQLQAAFSGKSTPQQAMENVQKGLKTLNP